MSSHPLPGRPQPKSPFRKRGSLQSAASPDVTQRDDRLTGPSAGCEGFWFHLPLIGGLEHMNVATRSPGPRWSLSSSCLGSSALLFCELDSRRNVATQGPTFREVLPRF
ncbi:AMP deaminase 2-like isoform X1 [Arapaima gigas]